MDWLWPEDQRGIPTDDRGLAYGHGLFETIRVTLHGPVLEGRHRDRLLKGCQALGIPFCAQAFAQWHQSAAARHLLDGTDRVLKLTVTAGSGGRGYRAPDPVVPRVITASRPAPCVPDGAVNVRSCRHPVQVAPGCGGLKTLGRIDQVLASDELSSSDFEGLMFDASGFAVEGTRTNLFVLRGDRVVTPPRETLAVSGTLRDWLAEALPALGYGFTEQPLTRQLILEHGLLLGNSVMGLVSANLLDDVGLTVSDPARTLQQTIATRLGLSR